MKKLRLDARTTEWMAGLLLLIGAAVVFVTHRTIPFMMDDLWYSTMLSDDTPIRSFGDIFQSQVWHYNNWGGRSITHSILQMVLLMGEAVADVLNVLVMYVLAWLMCRAAGCKSLLSLLASFSMVLGLNANWMLSMFWQAGAANYPYITIFLMLFLMCFLREVKGDAKNLPGITLWILPLGLIAGWSNENMGPSLWVISVLVMFMCYKEKRPIRLWMILGSLSCLAGSVIMIVAPGNFVRSSQIESEQYGLLWRTFLRCYAEAKGVMEYLFPALLVFGALLLISRIALNQKLERQELLVMFAALLSWGAMILSPHYPDRASFGTLSLLTVVCLSLGRKILKERPDMRPALLAGTAFIWLKAMYFCGSYLATSWGWFH